jgi:hypothetical protein
MNAEPPVSNVDDGVNEQENKLAVTFKLTPPMSDLLALLLTVPIASQKKISSLPTIKSDPKIAIHRLRTRYLAKHFGADIIKGKRTLGYWIDPEDKRRIWQKVKELYAEASDASRLSLLTEVNAIAAA